MVGHCSGRRVDCLESVETLDFDASAGQAEGREEADGASAYDYDVHWGLGHGGTEFLVRFGLSLAIRGRCHNSWWVVGLG